jgi:arginine:agmatine antiporter
MGILPRDALTQSPAPFSDAANAIWGPWAGGALAVAVMTLVSWRIEWVDPAHGSGADGGRAGRALPAMFGRISARGVPAFGIVLSVSLATALLLIEASGSYHLVSFYRAIVNLSVMAAAVPYVFCAGAACDRRAAR